MAAEYVCCSLTSQKKMYSYDSQQKKVDSYDSMLRNCQEEIRFYYDINGKLYDKFDPCYAVPLVGNK